MLTAGMLKGLLLGVSHLWPRISPKGTQFALSGISAEGGPGWQWLVCHICLVRVFTKEVRLLGGCKILSVWGISNPHLLEESCIPGWLELGPQLLWKQIMALILQGSGTRAERVNACATQHSIHVPERECVCVGIWDFQLPHSVFHLPVMQV